MTSLTIPAQICIRRRALDDLSPRDIADLQALLSAGELAGLPSRPVTRHYRLLVRGLLRQWLGEILDCDPRALEFTYGAHGKPGLPDHALQFNLAHSRRHLVLAWTREPVAIGIDIEDLGQRARAARLHTVLSPAEQALLAQSPRPETLFLAFWTRKEALLKARGHSIAMALETLDTAPLEQPHLRCDGQDFFLVTQEQDDLVVSLAAATSDTPELRWLTS